MLASDRAATRASSCAATLGAATSTSSSLDSRSSSGERDPTSPVAIFSMYGPSAASSQERRRQSGQARGSVTSAPPHLQRLRHLLLADLLDAGQVGEGLGEAQGAIVRAAAEPLPRVEIGEERSRVAAESAGPRLGRRHLPVRAPGSQAPFLALARRAHPLPDRGGGLARRAADLGGARLGDRREDVDPVRKGATQLALVALDVVRRAGAVGVGLPPA